MTSFVTQLESAIDGTRFEPGKLHTTHLGRPLWVRYDLDSVQEVLTKENATSATSDDVALSGIAAIQTRWFHCDFG
jgi:hypothetical protein